MPTWKGEVVRKLSAGGLGRGVRLKSSLCEVFHENTKLTPLSQRIAGARIAAFVKSKVAQRLVAAPYKVYSLMDREALPRVAPQGELEESIARRRSGRRYGGAPLARAEIARLLYLTYGELGAGRPARPLASGGGLYPLEFYVAALQVRDLEAGVYHYNVEDHCLDVIRRGDVDIGRLAEILWLEDIETPESIGAFVFVAACLERTTVKYGDRGYRLVLLEAGEAVHNLALLAGGMNLACCALGGFVDNALSEYLEIDGVEEVPLVPIVFGRMEEGGHVLR